VESEDETIKKNQKIKSLLNFIFKNGIAAKEIATAIAVKHDRK
jgi:hypothetical protein